MGDLWYTNPQVIGGIGITFVAAIAFFYKGLDLMKKLFGLFSNGNGKNGDRRKNSSGRRDEDKYVTRETCVGNMAVFSRDMAVVNTSLENGKNTMAALKTTIEHNQETQTEDMKKILMAIGELKGAIG